MGSGSATGADTLARRLRAAAGTSSRWAVCDGRRSIAYDILFAEANALISRWAGLGASRGPVAVLAEPTVSYVVALVAAVLSGRPYVALDPGYPAVRVGQMLADSGATILSGPAGLVHGHEGAGSWRVDRWPGAETAVDGAPDTSDTSDTSDTAGPPVREVVDVAAGDLAYVVFTSGSTGRARAVGVEHRAILNLLDDIDRRSPLGPQLRGSWWTSAAFDVSVWEIWSALTTGAELHVTPEEVRWDVAGFASFLVDRGVHSAYVPPTYLAALDDALRAAPTAALLRLLVGVEPIPLGTLQGLRQARPGLVVINGYGPAEATVCCTLYDVPDTGGDPLRRAPIGTAVRGLELRVLDPDRRPVAPGEAGELYVAGVGLARGYLNDEQANRERFVTDLPDAPGRRFYRTGDLVRELPGGALEFVGRGDRQFKIRGYRVEAAEIETAAAGLPRVRDAVAGTLPTDGGDLLALYVVAAAAPVPLPTELRAGLRAQLPWYAVPSTVVVLPELPQTRNGKVDHDALRRLGERARGEVRAGRTDSPDRHPQGEQDLFELWVASVGLPVDEVDPHLGFVELGGTSLDAVALVAQIKVGLHRRVDVVDVLRAESYSAFEALAAAAPPVAPAGTLAGNASEIEEPATPTQESVLVAAQMTTDPLAYVEGLIYRFDGAVPAELAAAALTAAVAALAALRTRIGSTPTGRPTYIFGAAPAEVSTVALSRPPDDEELRAYARDLALAPWQLEQAPPCRASVLAYDGMVRAMVLTAHHSALDGRTELLLRQAVQNAAAGQLDARQLRSGQPSVDRPSVGRPSVGRPSVGRGSADLADWLAARRREEALPRSEPDVRALRAIAASVLALPEPRAGLDGARVGPAGAPVLLPVPAIDRATIAAAARRRGVTPFVLLAAVAQRALAEVVGGRRFALLTPVDARDGAELEISGCLLALLPMAADGRPDAAVEALLTQTAQQAQCLMLARRCSFTELLAALPAGTLPRDPAQHVSFSTNAHPPILLPGGTGTWVAARFPRAKFGLDLVFEIDSAGGVSVLVEWMEAVGDLANPGRPVVDLASVVRLAARAGDELVALCRT